MVWILAILLPSMVLAGPRSYRRAPPSPSPYKNTQRIQIPARVDLRACNLGKERQASKPHLRRDWHLHALGIKAFLNHPSIQKVSLEQLQKKQVATVDSGLKLFRNPSAQPCQSWCIANSPEEDFCGHGTMVFGALTGKLGVDPQLFVKAFPVTIRNANGQRCPVSSDLIAQIRKAALTPEVSTINLSMQPPEVGFREQEEALRLAFQSGKFVVGAAGNLATYTPHWTTSYPVSRHDRFFEIGGISPYGMPALYSKKSVNEQSGSTYGPETDFYLPSTDLETLNAFYSPYTKSPETNLVGGTSVATPLFSAILTRLSAAFPLVDAKILRRALKKAAIVRGVEWISVPMVNPLLTAEMLTRAQPCLENHQSSSEACLDEATQSLQTELAIPPTPLQQNQNTCEAWETYYEDLERLFFLSRGAKSVSEAIQSVLNFANLGRTAESYYFGPPQETLSQLRKLGPLSTDDRVPYDYAHHFFTEDFKKETSQFGKAKTAKQVSVSDVEYPMVMVNTLSEEDLQAMERMRQEGKKDLSQLSPDKMNSKQRTQMFADDEKRWIRLESWFRTLGYRKLNIELAYEWLAEDGGIWDSIPLPSVHMLLKLAEQNEIAPTSDFWLRCYTRLAEEADNPKHKPDVTILTMAKLSRMTRVREYLRSEPKALTALQEKVMTLGTTEFNQPFYLEILSGSSGQPFGWELEHALKYQLSQKKEEIRSWKEIPLWLRALVSRDPEVFDDAVQLLNENPHSSFRHALANLLRELLHSDRHFESQVASRSDYESIRSLIRSN